MRRRGGRRGGGAGGDAAAAETRVAAICRGPGSRVEMERCRGGEASRDGDGENCPDSVGRAPRPGYIGLYWIELPLLAGCQRRRTEGPWEF